MVLLRKLRFDSPLSIQRMMRLRVPRVGRMKYPHVLLGILFLVILVVILTAYPVQSSRAPYLTYPTGGGQTFEIHPLNAGQGTPAVAIEPPSIPLTGR